VNETAALATLGAGKDVLEIGSAFGFSACVMALAGARHVTAVDPHSWLNSHEAMLSNLAACGVTGQVTVVRGTSPDALAGLGPFGLVFIDGDHGSAAVHADVEAALKVLGSGGVLACHDLGEDCCCPGVRAALDAPRGADAGAPRRGEARRAIPRGSPRSSRAVRPRHPVCPSRSRRLYIARRAEPIDTVP
jgi:predicted RNA methylase